MLPFHPRARPAPQQGFPLPPSQAAWAVPASLGRQLKSKRSLSSQRQNVHMIRTLFLISWRDGSQKRGQRKEESSGSSTQSLLWHIGGRGPYLSELPPFAPWLLGGPPLPRLSPPGCRCAFEAPGSEGEVSLRRQQDTSPQTSSPRTWRGCTPPSPACARGRGQMSTQGCVSPGGRGVSVFCGASSPALQGLRELANPQTNQSCISQNKDGGRNEVPPSDFALH